MYIVIYLLLGAAIWLVPAFAPIGIVALLVVLYRNISSALAEEDAE